MHDRSKRTWTSEDSWLLVQCNNMKWTAVIGSNGNLMSKFIYTDIENIKDQAYKKQIESLTQVTEQIVPTIWIKN